jgi:predicted nucleic acid-binding protein
MRTLLDTCVVSELNMREPNPLVETAVEQLGQENLYVSAITMGEIQMGISMLPPGRRRLGFEQWFGSVMGLYEDRIVDVDLKTSLIWGNLSARPWFRGRTALSIDLLLAATALNHGMRVMTRNTRDFAETGVLLVDPWQGSE